jgi:hypothetical protein
MGTNLASVDLGAGRTAVAVSAGAVHTCALLVRLPSGRLGGGDLQNGGNWTPPLQTESSTTLSMLKDSPHPSWLNRSVIVGGCSPQDDANLKCWGWNIDGQLGLGDTSNRGDDANGPCPPPRLSCLPHVF